MKVLFLYPNLRGMNMLPPSIAMLSTLLKQHGVQVGDHRLQLVDPRPVTASLLGAEEQHTQPDEGHAPDAAGDEVRHLLGDE